MPLTCRECGHGVHAKLSPKGLRFFAHDAVAPDCSLAGETIAHRLQATAGLSDSRRRLVRRARGRRRGMARRCPGHELRRRPPDRLGGPAAQITLDDLRERTARMAASGVPVCWVTDHDRPWIGAVPSIRLTVPVEPERPGQPRSSTVWEPSASTGARGVDAAGDDPPGPCPGHGFGGHPAQVGLGAFVSGVLQDSVRAHQVPRWSPGSNTGGTGFVWTTRPHVIAERAQLVATAQRRERDELEAAERERHLAAIAAKLARQQALTQPSVELVGSEARGYVGVRDATLAWAMGVPLFVHDMPQGVISPVVSRITAEVRDRLPRAHAVRGQ